MNLIYDASMMAGGPKARTGIGRVVASVAAELAGSTECATRFCTAASPRLESAVAEELAQRPFSTGSFVRAPLGEAPLYRGSVEMVRRLVPNRPNMDSGLTARALAFPFRAVCKIMERRACLLPASALDWADVFHSPAPPLSRPRFWPRQKRGARRTAAERRLKLFLTVYDLIAILHPEWFDGSLARRMRAALDTLTPDMWALCISRATRDDLLNHRPDLDPERVVVTHLAASGAFRPCADPTIRQALRSKYGIPRDVPYFLTLNTLEPRKNLDAVVEAFHRLTEQPGLPDLHLVLAGGQGWKFDRVMKLIEARPALRTRIVLTGFVHDDDLPALYSGAVGFVYPSLYEGFGLPPLEAMQCGVPVITSNISSLPEVVGDAGIMVAPCDLDAIAQAMLNLCANEGLRQSLSTAGLNRARQFSWAKCAAETIAAYKLAVAE